MRRCATSRPDLVADDRPAADGPVTEAERPAPGRPATRRRPSRSGPKPEARRPVGVSGGESLPAGTGPEREDRPGRLAAALGLRPRSLDYLRMALTHRSVLQDVAAAGGDVAAAALRTNERLEFLGDAVLGAIAAEYLFLTDPGADEGALTRRRVALVRAETLVGWARVIDLGTYLYLAASERPSGSARDRMLAGAFAALVGAIALDGGHAAARRFLRRFLTRDAAAIVAQAEGGANPKGRLQEVLQERFRTSPVYRTVATSGPDHARLFSVEVSFGGRHLGAGTGASKRDAQQVAAASALAVLAAEDDNGDLRGPWPEDLPPVGATEASEDGLEPPATVRSPRFDPSPAPEGCDPDPPRRPGSSDDQVSSPDGRR